MNRYEFLTKIHQLVGTRRYLEIGVQTGASLQCAASSPNIDTIVGVDPDLSLLQYQPEKTVLAEITSDEFFAAEPDFTGPDGSSWLDVVFIDGLHHSEQVWKDLYNAALLGHHKTVYILDDVLPRNQEEASRDMIPGDWTGDVWKVLTPLHDYLVDETLYGTVDTFPTGVAVICGDLNTVGMYDDYFTLEPRFLDTSVEVPDRILHRTYVNTPDSILKGVEQWLKA